MLDASPNYLLVFSTYVLITASPGPATMAIMSTAMVDGRRAGLAMAGGVITGSQCWGIASALGISSLLVALPMALRVIGVAGGLYFLWLAWKSLRAALQPGVPPPGTTLAGNPPLRRHFLRGFGIHITNPKAIMGWLSLIALGLGPHAPAHVAFTLVGGCLMLAILIFGTYAVAFSTAPMIRFYTRIRRPFQALVALMFTVAAVGLLMPQ
jgi:threonine efflux protein